MSRGRALLRHYFATPAAAPATPTPRPSLRAAPATPAAPAHVQPLTPILLGARPAPLGGSDRLPGRDTRTLVPSAFDAGERSTLMEDVAWFDAPPLPRAAEADPADADAEEDLFDWRSAPLPAPAPLSADDVVDWRAEPPAPAVHEPEEELPRVLGSAVELGVFFTGLTLGVAVQAAVAFFTYVVLTAGSAGA